MAFIVCGQVALMLPAYCCNFGQRKFLQWLVQVMRLIMGKDREKYHQFGEMRQTQTDRTSAQFVCVSVYKLNKQFLMRTNQEHTNGSATHRAQVLADKNATAAAACSSRQTSEQTPTSPLLRR